MVANVLRCRRRGVGGGGQWFYRLVPATIADPVQ